ncbi:hypothetical protein KAI46_06425 [bacterium]|nr:hypothetical protein [bacterium]
MTDVNVDGKAMVKKKAFNPGPPAYNGLSKIKRYLKDGKYRIGGKARKTADNDFGWEKADIVEALKKAQPQSFL